ncbi:MAG: transcription termination/antitermination protein NusA [Clostridia bacterium]|nr:transcription termination/antitermination protein NusA [Clostridia bacterium]
MNKEFFDALDLLEKEKKIPKDLMLEKVEAALVAAYKRDQDGNSNVRVVLDPVKKDVKLYKQLEVVEVVEDPATQISLEDAKALSKKHKLGGVVEIEIKPKNFRRNSAHKAKQVIIQAIRDVERGRERTEYESKIGNVITAVVNRVDPDTGNALIDTGTSFIMLVKNEQIPGEELMVGDHIKVYVTEINKENRGPMVVLSRTHPGLVEKLFELNIPEIQDGVVTIRGISREAGSRTKLAVESSDPNIDPVGSCIGNRGSRINDIVDELCGEKIDVIKYSDIPEDYIRAALSPAEVDSVIIDEENVARVTVDPDQLSLAIGREGQNARLAARLTGYKIDIKPEG